MCSWLAPPPLFPQSIYPVFFPVFLVTDTHHFFLSRVCWAKTIFFPSFKPEALVPLPPIPHWSLITWRHCVSGQSTQASTEQDELSQRLARLRQVWERGGGHHLLVSQDHASCSTIFSLWNLITLCGLTVWKFMQHSALNNNNRL